MEQEIRFCKASDGVRIAYAASAEGYPIVFVHGWAPPRVCAEVNAGEILVSNVVRELAAGKGFLFNDRGDHALKGFEDPVKLYEVSWRG